MNSKNTKDQCSIKILSQSALTDCGGKTGEAHEISVSTVFFDDDLRDAWLYCALPVSGDRYMTRNEWRYYNSSLEEQREEIEAEIHTALGIFANYEQEAVIIKHVVGNVCGEHSVFTCRAVGGFGGGRDHSEDG